jgi:hypothetical protein
MPDKVSKVLEMTHQSVFSNLLDSVFHYFRSFGNLEDLVCHLARKYHVSLGNSKEGSVP